MTTSYINFMIRESLEEEMLQAMQIKLFPMTLIFKAKIDARDNNICHIDSTDLKFLIDLVRRTSMSNLEKLFLKILKPITIRSFAIDYRMNTIMMNQLLIDLGFNEISTTVNIPNKYERTFKNQEELLQFLLNTQSSIDSIDPIKMLI